jgi:hypothetical protein
MKNPPQEWSYGGFFILGGITLFIKNPSKIALAGACKGQTDHSVDQAKLIHSFGRDSTATTLNSPVRENAL